MYEGTLEEGELVPTLRWISALRQGGLLSVQGEPDLVSVTFEGGAIVAADAMNRPAEEMLGEVLARRGLLDPADFAAAVEPYMGTGRLASEVLAERGLVSREDLLDAVREQTYSQVVRLLRWDSGNFNWTPKVESPFEVGMRPISIAELLLRSSEDLGAEGPLRGSPPSLDEVFQADTEKTPPRVIDRADDWEPGANDTAWLTPVEGQLLAALREHQSTGSRLATETGLDPLEVSYGLHELRRAGLARSMEEPSPSAIEIDHAIEPLGPSALARSGESPSLDWSAAPLADPLRAEPESLPSVVGELRFDEDLAALRADVEPAEAAPAWAPVEMPEVREPVSQSFRPGGTSGTRGTGGTGAGTGRWPRRSVALHRTSTWLARGLGLALALLVSTLLIRPPQHNSLLFPFPWQGEARRAYENSQMTALYDKVDGAVRTYYLLYGRYPEELGILVDLELLRPRELFDPRGRWLQYTVLDRGYTLRPLDSGALATAVGTRAELSSDFFLDPQFVELPAPRPNPVVLLE